MIPHDGFSLYLVQTGQQKILLTDCERREIAVLVNKSYHFYQGMD
jgi:hypothetical protein